MRFDDFAIAERSGGVLLVRAVKDGMTADEFKGAFYAYAPSSVRKDVFEQSLGFRAADSSRAAATYGSARYQPEDAAAVAAGDVDQAVSFFGMAGAMQTQIGRQLAAEGSPAGEVDGVRRDRRWR